MIMCTGLTPEGVQDAAKQAVKGRVIGASADARAKQNEIYEQMLGNANKIKKKK